jgi:hypothetical protein
MNVEVPGSFEAAFAARLSSELDEVPVRRLGAWPVMRRTRRITFVSAAAFAVAAALLLGTLGALAYGSPGALVQTVVNSFGPRPDHHFNGIAPTPETTPSPSVEPVQPLPVERESPSPGQTEHESPEPTQPTRPTGGESPGPHDGGSSPSPRPSGSPPPDE